MRIDYLGLEAFVAIAEQGSFQRAAARLHLSQTALSHRIRKLEDDLGLQLLIRTTREVSLTRAGQEVLPRVRQLLRELSESYGQLYEQGRRKQERLAFACLPTIANSILPGVLARYCEDRPDIAISLRDRPFPVINELVQTGEVEFGITIVFANQTDLEVRPVVDEPYVLLVPRDHPLASRGHVARRDLDGVPMARISTQSNNRQLVEDGLGEYRERMMWRYEVWNATAAMSLVAEGAALTILPRLAVHVSNRKLVPLPFSDVKLTRTLGIVTRRGVPLSEAATELVAMIVARLLALGNSGGEAEAAPPVAPELSAAADAPPA
ncbi:LysR family transcriptional regulator [Lutibaculum baratangense]|uniref:Transcriptional regulator, LysR family n=1 Tax=Lutibaculum baratangense AMV1 TaxID=631454 RepID=V4R4U1_9HYPH|nr:LysR family transcriptional regulator [Lutibaculum baratangense]ESR26952.1 transcriptional regulator, LysR family [Lutibaculum baratangense AMV1]